MTDLKKLLLAGTAIVAIGATAPAFAAPHELDDGADVVAGTTISDNDQIVDDTDEGTDDLVVDLDGNALTLGTDGATAGIDVTGDVTGAGDPDGDADASELYITNTSTTAATVTVEDSAGGVAINVDDEQTNGFTIVLGEDDDGLAATAATNMVVDGDVATATNGVVNFNLTGFDGNTLTFMGDVDLAATGVITMDGENDTVVFNGTTTFVGDIDGGNISVLEDVDLGDVAFGGGADVLSLTVAAGKVAEVGASITTDEDGDDFVLGGADAEINVTGTATLTGNVTTSTAGTGNLNLDAATDIVGSIGTATTAIGTVDIADGFSLTVDATTADVVVNATELVINEADLDEGLVLDTSGNDNDITVYSVVKTATGGDGLVSTANEGTVTFMADIGEEEAEVGLVDVGTAGGNSSVVTNGNVYAADVDINNESTLTIMGTGVTVSGTVGGAGDGEGNLVVGDGETTTSVTFGDTVGVTNDLDLFHITEGATANVSGDVNVTADAGGTTGLNLEGTLNVDTTTAAVTVDTVTGVTVLNGTLRVTGDTGTSGLTLGGTNITAAATGAGVTDSAAIYAGDVLTLAAGTLTVGDGTGDTLTIYAAGRDGDGADDDGFSAVDAAAVVAGGGTNLTVTNGSTLRFGLSGGEYDSGDSITFVDNIAAGGNITNIETAVGAGSVTLLNSGLVTLTLDEANSDADTLVATVGFRDATNVFSKKTYAGAANALLGMTSASTTGELATIRANLTSSATSASASEEVAESISPTVDGGATSVAMTNVSNSANGLTGQRLASLRDGTSETGMAAGNLTHGLKMWAQVFGSTGEQDERDGISGYDVDSYGVTVGVDTQTLAEDWVWGLAFTYADTEVDSNNVNSTNTEIDTYQIALYADYKWDAQTYVNGIVGYGFNDADQTRHNVGTIAGLSANSDFDTDQFFAKLETGRDYEMNNGTTLTPFALANFSYLDTEGYTETGAGTANLTVDTDDQYIFELGLGLEASWLHELEDGSYLKPSLVAGYRYDLADDEVEATSTFTGGGVAFQTEGFDPQNHTFNVGAGLTFYTTANWELSADYNYELKEDYDSHNGFVRAAYRF